MAPLRVIVTDCPEHILVVLTEMEEAATGTGSTVTVTVVEYAEPQTPLVIFALKHVVDASAAVT